MENNNQSLKKNKEESLLYDFLLLQGQQNHGKHFANNYTGLPALPIPGQYARGSYQFNDINTVLAIECFCDKEKQIVQNIQTSEIVYIPQEVKDIIFNIKNPIPHNKPPQEQDQNTKQGKGEGNQNCKNEEEKQQKKENNVPDFHPIQFQNAQNINFVFQISYQNKRITFKKEQNQNGQQNKNKNKKKQGKQQRNQKYQKQIYEKEETNDKEIQNIVDNLFTNNDQQQEQQPEQQQQNEEEKIDVNNQKVKDNKNQQEWLEMNLVCHPFIFQEILFDGKKNRMVQHLPICLVIPQDIQDQGICNVKEFDKQVKQQLKFGEPRSEYMSCHMGKQMSLCFSPNNMKYYMKFDSKYQIYWSILLDELGFHHVFLHLNISDQEMQEQTKKNTQTSINLEQLLKGFELIFGKDNIAIQHIFKVFNYKQ